MLLNVDNVSA